MSDAIPPKSGGLPCPTGLPKFEDSIRSEFVEWLINLRPWNYKFDCTFRGEFTEAASMRAFERYADTQIPELDYVYGIEPNPSRAGHHVHAVLCGPADLHRHSVWGPWQRRYGRAVCQPVRDAADCIGYAGKLAALSYATKSGGWWNVKLRDRHPDWGYES